MTDERHKTAHSGATAYKPMDRRGFVIGAATIAALGAAPTRAVASSDTRRFKLIRGDEEVGYHSLTAKKSGQDLSIDIRILIEIRRLGIRFFVYEHENTEVWRNGALMSLTSKTNDDGKKHFCSVALKSGALQIKGSKFNGALPGEARPSTYWNYDNLSQKPWFSSQSGEALAVSRTKSRDGDLERWAIAGDFSTTLFYDGAKEWRGCSFDAGGTPITYEQVESGPRFNALV